MKKLLLSSILFFNNLFAIIGFGAYGNQDFVTYPSNTSSSGAYTINSSGFEKAVGIGFFVYLDVLPIDIQLDFEFVGNTNDLNALVEELDLAEGPLLWARNSTYLTARKTWKEVKIPFFAKAQVFYGGGLNWHNALPEITVDLFEEAFSGDLAETLIKIDESKHVDELIDYILDNIDKTTGLHLQAGAQVKILAANAFVNARYTLAKDVVPDSSGFLSIWAGLAFGF